MDEHDITSKRHIKSKSLGLLVGVVPEDRGLAASGSWASGKGQ